MKIKVNLSIILLVLLHLSACNTSQKFPAKIYEENQSVLDKTVMTYDQMYQKQPFSLGFTDNSLTEIGLEIHLDSLTKVYNFKNKALDSSHVFPKNIDKKLLQTLLNNMKQLKSVWISKADYYRKKEKHLCTFITLKPISFNKPLQNVQYYTLIYFDEIVNLDVNIKYKNLKKLNDRVYSTIVSQFR